MGVNKCPECNDDLKLVVVGGADAKWIHDENIEAYWVHTGDIDPECSLRNVAE